MSEAPARAGVRLLALVLGLACSALQACASAHVQPWQRERLAHRCMAAEVDPDGASFRAHVDGARQAALNPSASGGGGCGCN